YFRTVQNSTAQRASSLPGSSTPSSSEPRLPATQARCLRSGFSLWFQEFLPIAPCLAITGSAHEGDLVLRTLRAFCRCGHLVAGLTMAKMGRFFYTQTPTLLIFEPNLSKRMASFLGCTTRRGYMEEKDRYFFDHFCSKAIYLGENLPLKSMLQHCVHIDASPTPGVETHYAPPLSE